MLISILLVEQLLVVSPAMDEGRPPRFARPRVIGGEEACAHLFVANCGPKVGISLDRIAQAFGGFGDVVAVRNADDSGARVIVSFTEAASARAAMVSLNGARCPHLDNRVLHVSYSSQVPCKVRLSRDWGALLFHTSIAAVILSLVSPSGKP